MSGDGVKLHGDRRVGGLRAQGGGWLAGLGGPSFPKLADSRRAGAVAGEGGRRSGEGQQEGQTCPPTASPFPGSGGRGQGPRESLPVRPQCPCDARYGVNNRDDSGYRRIF